MKRELELRCIPYESQVKVPIDFKGFTFSDTLRTDLYIDRCLIVELKAAKKLAPIEPAKVLSYMKLLNSPLGLIINFHEIMLKDGITRLIMKGADKF